MFRVLSGISTAETSMSHKYELGETLILSFLPILHNTNMEILQDKALGRHLFEKYSSNPKNWNFIISTSPFRDGFFDATVSNNEEVWQLKIDSIYKPIPMVIGTRVDTDSGKIQKMTSGNNAMFGYRELGSSAILDILEKLTREQEDNATKESNIEGGTNLNSILSSLEPVIPVKGKDYAYGPFVYTERNHISSNEYQKILQSNYP